MQTIETYDFAGKKALKSGEVLMLENLRFNKGEENKDAFFPELLP